jgi:septum formation protein
METGVAFERIVPSIDEYQIPGEDPFDFALRLAEEKALAVDEDVNDGRMILGCDTIVVLDNNILGKPSDAAEAFETLRTLSGKQHEVCTAAAFATESRVLASGYSSTRVFFNSVADAQIREYIETGEPADKAGAYGIQGMGAFLVDRIEGCLDTVIGLPRNLLDRLSERVLGQVQEG